MRRLSLKSTDFGVDPFGVLGLLLNPNNQLFTNRGVVSQISPDSELAENGLVARNFKRRERDLNPRNPCGLNGFQDRRNRPLCHLSFLSFLHNIIFLFLATFLSNLFHFIFSFHISQNILSFSPYFLF